MNDFESDWIRLSQTFVQNGRIQYGRIQDGNHHSVNQMELVWDTVREEEECFWVNLREDNKVSENPRWQCLNPTWQISRWLPSSSWVRMNKWSFLLCKMAESMMAEFKMAAIIKLSQIEWVKFFLCKMVESMMAEFKVASIIKLSENEWVWVRLN